MLARIQSYLMQGIDAAPCEVEIDLDDRAERRETVVGLPDAAVKESLERVRSALANSGYTTPNGRLLVNLAPADLRKEGPLYDLPIAVGMLTASGVIRPGEREGLDVRQHVIAGELALDGRVRPIRGVLAAASLARAEGARGIIVPAENAEEASVVEGIEVFGVRTLTELVGLLTGSLPAESCPPADLGGMLREAAAPVDFGEVRGQEAVKRAIVVAAAGGHNLLMLGPAGTGKTMMARALPGILPPMSPEEALEVTRICSAAGCLPEGRGLVVVRPVRSPHHTASAAAVIGGGVIPRPGEISMAHRGVLFLDELAEFPRFVLDTLRQPLEEGQVTVSRSHSTVRFPAKFMLVAAMNPTQRGDMPTDHVGRAAMDRYLSRLSRPLLDRIDVHVEAPAVAWKELVGGPRGTDSATMRARVEVARGRQRARQGDRLNAHLSGSQLDRLAPIDGRASALLGQAITEMGLSARAYDKIRRLARTIADIADRDAIDAGDVAEAIQYRLLDRRV